MSQGRRAPIPLPDGYQYIGQNNPSAHVAAGREAKPRYVRALCGTRCFGNPNAMQFVCVQCAQILALSEPDVLLAWGGTRRRGKHGWVVDWPAETAKAI